MIEPFQPWVAVVLGGSALLMLRDGAHRLRGTTLVAPWSWAIGAVIVVTAIEAMAGLSSIADASWIEPARFAAACLTFCPTVAILGAKRPQDRAWQLIVLALWVVLALPAGEAWLRGAMIEVHAVRSAFLVILILVGLFNYLPTRFAAAAAVYSAAQTALFAPHLPLFPGWTSPNAGLAGLGLLLLSALVLRALARAETAVEMDEAPIADLARVWREFCDWYGAVWSLRVIERMNASAQLAAWPVKLEWQGFVRPRLDDEPNSRVLSEADKKAVDGSLCSLLRRFVSTEWIQQRRLTATKTI